MKSLCLGAAVVTMTLAMSAYGGTKQFGAFWSDGSDKKPPVLVAAACSPPCMGTQQCINGSCTGPKPKVIVSWHVYELKAPPDVKLKEISAGSTDDIEGVWALDAAGKPWKFKVSWTEAKCCVSNLSVAQDGTLWATNPEDAGKLLRVLKLDAAKNEWTSTISPGMKQVAAVNSTEAWGLDASNALYKLNGSKWEKQANGCCAEQISVGSDGALWGVSSTSKAGPIMQWTGSEWKTMPGGNGMFVSVANKSTIWALTSPTTVRKWTGTGWADMGFSLGNTPFKRIAAASDSLWGLTANGLIVKWEPVYK